MGRQSRRSDRGDASPPLVAFGFLSVARLCSPVPRCMCSRSGCRSSRLGPVSCCRISFLPRVERVLTLSQRSFVGGGSLAHLAQFPPLDTCVFVLFQTLNCESSSVKHLSPPAFHLRPSCCYRLRTCLTLSLLRLLSSSAISCRCLPVSLSLPPVVSPFHVASAVRSCTQVRRSSAPRLCWLLTRSALGRRDVRLLHSVLLGKGRLCHIGALCS